MGLEAAFGLVYFITKGEAPVYSTDCVCTCGVNSCSSAFDVIKVLFRFIVFVINMFEAFRDEGRFGCSFGL